MVLRPKNINIMAPIQVIIPNPNTGIKKGCPWFLNELCITTGPKKNMGNAQPKRVNPFTSIFLFVAIMLYRFSYVFMFLQQAFRFFSLYIKLIHNHTYTPVYKFMVT